MKSLLLHLEPAELVRLCNDKMICAARDLAEFTQHGLNAHFIVSLAYTCEAFEKMLERSHPLQGSEFYRLRNEILEKLSQLCETGKKIWSNYPTKYRNYVIIDRYLGNAAPFAA